MKDLILLHGALGSESLFDPLKDELRHHYHLHSLNFSGHGGAPFSKSGFGIEVFASELKSFITDRQLQQVEVFGYSMGGYVALYLETLEPGTFACITTLGTKFDWNPDAARHEVSRLNPEKIKAKVPAFAKMLEDRHGSQWGLLLDATAQMMMRLGEQPLLTAANLQGISTSVTVALGDQDNMVTPEESERAANAMPQGNFMMLANTLHPIEKVNPRLVRELLAR